VSVEDLDDQVDEVWESTSKSLSLVETNSWLLS